LSSGQTCRSPSQLVLLTLTPSQLSRPREAKEPIGLQSNTPNSNTDVNKMRWGASTGLDVGFVEGEMHNVLM